MDQIAHRVLLRFDPDLDRLDKDKQLRDGLSAVVLVENTLWAPATRLRDSKGSHVKTQMSFLPTRLFR